MDHQCPSYIYISHWKISPAMIASAVAWSKIPLDTAQVRQAEVASVNAGVQPQVMSVHLRDREGGEYM